jgi:iron only hydrogenase large subunit-like protein
LDKEDIEIEFKDDLKKCPICGCCMYSCSNELNSFTYGTELMEWYECPICDYVLPF